MDRSWYPDIDFAELGDEQTAARPKLSPGKRTLTMRLPARTSGLVQRKTESGVQATKPTRELEAARGSSGRPLPAELEESLGAALETDLSQVRTHAGPTSDAAARSIGAKAYTEGSDIHFAAGTYEPETEQGQHLIAHEVAHTAQQANGAVANQRKSVISEPGDSHEREADAFADAFVSHAPAPPVRTVNPGIARSPMRGGAPGSTTATAGSGFIDDAHEQLKNGTRSLTDLEGAAQLWCDALHANEMVPLRAAGKSMTAAADAVVAAIAGARKQLALHDAYGAPLTAGDEWTKALVAVESFENRVRARWRVVLLKIGPANMTPLPTGELWELTAKARLAGVIGRVVDFLAAFDDAAKQQDLLSAGGAILQLLGSFGSPADAVFFEQLLAARFKGKSMLPLNPELAAASDPFAGAQALSDVEVLAQQDAVRTLLAEFQVGGIGGDAAGLRTEQYGRLRAILAGLEFVAADRNLKQNLLDGETIRMRDADWPTDPGRARAVMEKRWPVKVQKAGKPDDYLKRNYYLDKAAFHGALKLAGDSTDLGRTNKEEGDRLYAMYVEQHDLLELEEDEFKRAFEDTAKEQLRSQLDESEANAYRVLEQYGMRYDKSKNTYFYKESGKDSREELQKLGKELLAEQTKLDTLHFEHVSAIGQWLRRVADGGGNSRVDDPFDRLWEPGMPESFFDAIQFYMAGMPGTGNLGAPAILGQLAADVRAGNIKVDQATLDETADLEAKHRALRIQTGQFQAFWAEREAKHPMLAAYRNSQGMGKTDQLQQMASAESKEIPQEVADRVAKVLASIKETREDAFDDEDHSIWELPRIVVQTKALMGVAPGSMRAEVIDNKARIENQPSGWEVAVVALSLALAPFTGGSSLVLAAEVGLLALDAYLAYQRIDDYRFQKAAANTDFDTLKTIAASEPSLFWVVAEIAALGVGIGATAVAFRHARRLRQLKAAGKHDSAEALAVKKKLDELSGDDEISKKLLADGSADVTDARKVDNATDAPPKEPGDLLVRGKGAQRVTGGLDEAASVTDPAVRETLSRRIGATVELDPDIGGGVVLRQSDADPDIVVVRVGPDADVDHVLGQAEKIEGLKKQTKIAQAEKTARVEEPVEGLYEQVDPDTVPEGWQVEDTVSPPKSNGKIEIRTKLTAPNGATGRMRRVYDPNTNTLSMEAAFFDDDLPRWVSAGKAMVPAKGGTPTFAYVQMRQMRKLGIGRSGLEKVHMSTIANERTILELGQARKAGVDLDEAILDTHSVKYAETSMVQSGHKIRKATVTGGDEIDVRTVLPPPTGPNADAIKKTNEELLAKYGLEETDKVLWGFDIDIEVMPWE